MNDKDIERIGELIDLGFYVSEKTLYVIKDAQGREYGQAESEDWAWHDTFRFVDRQAEYEARQKLAAWNKAVAGVKE